MDVLISEAKIIAFYVIEDSEHKLRATDIFTLIERCDLRLKDTKLVNRLWRLRQEVRTLW